MVHIQHVFVLVSFGHFISSLLIHVMWLAIFFGVSSVHKHNRVWTLGPFKLTEINLDQGMDT